MCASDLCNCQYRAHSGFRVQHPKPVQCSCNIRFGSAPVSYFKAIDSYNRLNITNANLYRANKRLEKAYDKLTRGNENLRAENGDYKLLRKVFGNKRIDDLLEQARSKQREKRFRNIQNER